MQAAALLGHAAHAMSRMLERAGDLKKHHLRVI